jgi:hypothetical protein
MRKCDFTGLVRICEEKEEKHFCNILKKNEEMLDFTSQEENLLSQYEIFKDTEDLD